MGARVGVAAGGAEAGALGGAHARALQRALFVGRVYWGRGGGGCASRPCLGSLVAGTRGLRAPSGGGCLALERAYT